MPADPDNDVTGLPPVVGGQPVALFLGNAPSVLSLARQQYYGNPRNAFWPIMAAVFGFDVTVPYLQRVAALQQNGVAVWDVLAACERPGSLDVDIVSDSIRVNDFDQFLRAHPGLRSVCFNGAKAQAIFRRQVLPMLAATPTFNMIQLPSTSPAHAGMPFDEKCRLWRQSLLQT